MLEMAINNVEMGSELDRVHILTCCDGMHFQSLYGQPSVQISNKNDIC